MSTEKAKTTKGETVVEDTKDLHELVSDLLGEKAVHAFLETARVKSDKLVEKNKKDLKGEALEDFREACLRRSVFELLREFTVDAAQPRIMSKRWWSDALLKGVVNAAVLGGGLVVFGAITRARDTSSEIAGETTGQEDNPFAASPRPSKRNFNKDMAAI